ncbi:hypothetical protein FBU30_010120 [Linnemannia zychae]|nr:hypothetical protein FBU30_010120 [Linnemannia zychae]
MASTSTTPGTGTVGQDVESITHIQMAGLTVLMIKKKDQVIYKLPDNMSVTSLTQDQRERLLAEINLLHHQQTTAQAIAVTNAQTQQVQLAQAAAQAAAQARAAAQGGVRSIAPVSQPSTSQAPVSSLASSTPRLPTLSARPNQPTGADQQQKTTRRYNKTGKYSKKKLLQQQQEAERSGASTGSQANTGLTGQGQAVQDRANQSLVLNNTPSQTLQATAGASLTTGTAPLSGSPGGKSSATLQSPGTPTTSKPIQIPIQPSASANSSAVTLTPLQKQTQTSPALALATPDQMKQLRLLQEIHLVQQQIEAQRTRVDTFREHDLAVRRLLASQRPVDAKTIQLAKEKLAEAEGSLEKFWNLLREKEATFREQFPVASQQLLLLQQQQQLARAAANTGTTGSSTPPTRPQTLTTPYLNITPLLGGLSKRTTAVQAEDEKFKQEMKQYHESVSNGMSREVENVHKNLAAPEWRMPFKSLEDAIQRLLPFHVYQYPTQDMESHAKAFSERPEEELNARALRIHRRKHQLVEKYRELIKTQATKRTRTNPSAALDIVALRCGLVDEKESHRVVFEENERVQAEGKLLKEELERRQAILLQQRKAEAALIEQQQRLMLERQREEALEAEKQKLLAEQRQRLIAMQAEQQGLDSQNILTEEQEAERKKEEERKELERQHQLELEKQMRIQQEQAERVLSHSGIGEGSGAIGQGQKLGEKNLESLAAGCQGDSHSAGKESGNKVSSSGSSSSNT